MAMWFLENWVSLRSHPLSLISWNTFYLKTSTQKFSAKSVFLARLGQNFTCCLCRSEDFPQSVLICKASFLDQTGLSSVFKNFPICSVTKSYELRMMNLTVRVGY